MSPQQSDAAQPTRDQVVASLDAFLAYLDKHRSDHADPLRAGLRVEERDGGWVTTGLPLDESGAPVLELDRKLGQGQPIKNILTLPLDLDCASIRLINQNTTKIRNVPAGLRHLELDCAPLQEIPELPYGLELLSVAGGQFSGPITHLPATLVELHLRGHYIRGPKRKTCTIECDLPPALVRLSMEGVICPSLPPLPDTLEALECYTDLEELPTLPAGLRELSVPGDAVAPDRQPLELPDSIEELAWFAAGPDELVRLPTSLRRLRWDGEHPPPPLPEDLRELTVCGTCPTEPAIPATVTSFEITRAAATRLPALSPVLERLRVSDTPLVTLPELPGTLTSISCTKTPLPRLPALPSSLVTLWCPDNELTELPAIPDGVETINVENNALTHLPSIPASTESLRCARNELTQLPSLTAWWEQDHVAAAAADPKRPIDLAQGMRVLECHHNRLTELPTLPPGLSVLRCNHNRLIALPDELPLLIEYLNCSDNRLTRIDNLPFKVREFYCGNNPDLTTITTWQGYDLDKLVKFSAPNSPLTDVPERLRG